MVFPPIETLVPLDAPITPATTTFSRRIDRYIRADVLSILIVIRLGRKPLRGYRRY